MSAFYNKLPALLLTATLASVTTTGVAWSDSGDQEARQEWLNQAEAVLDANMTYPKRIMRVRPSGKAIARLTIDETGSITSYSITKSTGSNLLDREVEAMIERVDSFPAPVHFEPGNTILNVNLNYLGSASASDYAALASASKRQNKGRVTSERVASKRGAPNRASIEIASNDND